MSDGPVRVIAPSDVATEVFVPPSDEALALLRRLPSVMTPAPGDGLSAGRLVRDLVVAPFTQLTFLSFDLQAFLFGVLHTTWIARGGHLLGMSLVNLGLMAALTAVSPAGWGMDLGGIYAGALLCWYAVVSRDARLPGWWAAMVPVVALLYAGAQAALGATAGHAALGYQPLSWVAMGAVITSFSHLSDPRLPPRVGDPIRWVPHLEFLLGPPGARLPLRTVVRRMAWLATWFVFGTLDELWASPRLLPYNILHLLFAVGYAPAVRAKLADRVDRALASGNPALDYVGVGGGATLAPRP